MGRLAGGLGEVFGMARFLAVLSWRSCFGVVGGGGESSSCSCSGIGGTGFLDGNSKGRAVPLGWVWAGRDDSGRARTGIVVGDFCKIGYEDLRIGSSRLCGERGERLEEVGSCL